MKKVLLMDADLTDYVMISFSTFQNFLSHTMNNDHTETKLYFYVQTALKTR